LEKGSSVGNIVSGEVANQHSSNKWHYELLQVVLRQTM
jgi:hypothetical protein